MADTRPPLTWVEEMPLPETNLEIFWRTYILENWLRRLTLASLMAKAGSRWIEVFPDDLLREAKKQVSLLRRRTFLEPENSDNLVWALTLDQLRSILTASELSSFIFDLTGLSRPELDKQLEKLRDIRNIVAHNRATNEVALENLLLVEKKLAEAIRFFKRRLVYMDGAWEVLIEREIDEEGEVITRLAQPPELVVEAFFKQSGLAEGREFIVRERGRFHEFGVVFAERSEADFIEIGVLLDAFHPVRHAVLAVVLPLPTSGSHGAEFSLLWPKDVTEGELETIRDVALSIRGDTKIPYGEQDPKFVCDPMIWFEGGWEGQAEAGSEFTPDMFKLR